MHCRPKVDALDYEDERKRRENEQKAAIKKTKRGHVFSPDYNPLACYKRSVDTLKDKQDEEDGMIYGFEYADSKKASTGVSIGGMTNGIYGGVDLIFSKRLEEYMLLTKMGDVIKFDWSGTKVGIVTPNKKFSRFVHLYHTGHNVCYTPGKSYFYIFREDWTVAIDTVAISRIDKMFYGGRKTEENNLEFFIVSGCTLNKYAYSPVNNVVSLQDSLKLSDIEAEGADIEQIAWDLPLHDKKQWMYLTFRQHVSIIDVAGRVHGTKKFLHKNKITAIVAYGASEFVVTGDEKGVLKMWGPRWSLIQEIAPYTAKIMHLITHPTERTVIAFCADLNICAWNLDTKANLEVMKAPEIAERIAQDPDNQAFVTSGPRKLILWQVSVLFGETAPPSDPLADADLLLQQDKEPPPKEEPKEDKRPPRNKEYEKYKALEDDLWQIIEGNHQFSIHVPDFRKMTKKQIDEYGKTIFPDDGDKRKMFASESRIDCLHEMEKHAKDFENDKSAM